MEEISKTKLNSKFIISLLFLCLALGGCSNDYNPDDKDSDGDVDYDDVEKYLKDSLEEDVNDGDDW